MKRGKSGVAIAVILVAAMLLTFALVACEKDDGCEHVNLRHVAAIDATCVEDGNVEFWYCPDCGKYYSDEMGEHAISIDDTVIAATGEHDWGEWVTDSESSCTTGGTRHRVCNVCGERQDEILPFAHDMTYVSVRSATCTEAGNVAYWHCNVCGCDYADEDGAQKLDTVVVPAKGHSYADEWSCNEFGHWHAATCGHEVRGEYSAHKYSASNHCGICGYQLVATKGLRYSYDVATDSYRIVGIGSATDNKIIIPAAYNSIAVTSIADEAFLGYSDLTTVTIPGTITSLGDNVFEGCTSLEKIIFQGSIEQWGVLESNSSGNDKLVVECIDGRYRFFVTYDLDGGVNAASNPSSYTMDTLGGADGSIALADLSKKGEISYTASGDGSIEVTQNVYTFLGWYKDPSFEQKVTSLTLDLGDVTLYAKWSEPVTQTETKQYVRVDENNEVDTQGEYILFGWYPQTIKADDVTVGDVADEDGYYLGSDGERYANVVAYPHESGYTFSDGSEVTYGETYYFKVEPIRWRILSESDGSAFILADGIIANKAYAAIKNCIYKYSAIRAWLNDELLNSAFGEVAQGLIETTEVDNSAYSTGHNSNPNACENTSDKVFLLSYREVINSDYGFASTSWTYDTARRMTVSDYARSTGAYTHMNTSNSYYGCGEWWLRSPNASAMCEIAHSVPAFGSPHYGGGVVHIVDYFGVVPAMNIKL